MDFGLVADSVRFQALAAQCGQGATVIAVVEIMQWWKLCSGGNYDVNFDFLICA
jgi:hypothetical protein